MRIQRRELHPVALVAIAALLPTAVAVPPEVAVAPRILRQEDPVLSLAFSPDGALLASGGENVTVWKVASGGRLTVIRHLRYYASSVAFVPHSHSLVTGEYEEDGATGAVQIWNCRNGHSEGALKGIRSGVGSVALSEDGRVLLTAECRDDGSFGALKVWNLRTRQLVRKLGNGADAPGALAIRAAIASSGSNGKLTLWNIDTGKALWTRKHNDGVTSTAISRDGRLVASAGCDVRLWGAKNGTAVCALKALGDEVSCVAFSTDGKLVAAGCLQFPNDSIVGKSDIRGPTSYVMLWDAATRRLSATLRQPGRLYCVSFSPDGKSIATGGDDGLIRIWKLPARR